MYIDRDVTVISREVYNLFMLFGDVGGLSGLFYTLSALLINVLTYNNSENYLTKSLYERPTKQTGTSNLDSSLSLVSESAKTSDEDLNPARQHALKEYL